MRILFLTHYFPPEGNAPASRVHALCKRWAAAGHEVTVVTCVPNVPDGVVYPGYSNRWRQEETMDGILVVRVWTFLAPNKGTVRRIANYVSYMLTAAWQALRVARPEILIATSPQFFCGWAGVLVATLRRLPFVLEIRDIWPESIAAVEAMRNQWLFRILEWVEARMYRSASQIVTVGEGYKQRLVQKGVPPGKIQVIMNGLDADIFQPQEPDAALALRWGLVDKFVCSYSGTIGMACGLDTVLEVAHFLKEQGEKNIVFLLVGDGAVREELQRKAELMRLDNLVFTGRQPKELMPGFLALSDICLVHLRKTSLFASVMPSKIFEAAGMKKPIINGVEGFAAEFIQRAGAGINIEPENSRQLAEALLNLQASPERRRAFGESGYAYVRTHFDRDNLAMDYITLLENTIRVRSPICRLSGG